MNITKITKEKNNYKPNKELLSYCEQFKNIDEFKKFIIKNEKCPDYIAIDSIPFTMENYDMSGKSILYFNEKLKLEIEVKHENRYKDFANVLSVEIYEGSFWRNDITYLE